MSRHEHENLDGLDIPSPIIYEKYLYNENGELTDNESDLIVAREIRNPVNNFSSYYILFNLGRLFNTRSYTKRDLKNTKMRKVSKNVYDLYIMYLETKRLTYLHQAERLL